MFKSLLLVALIATCLASDLCPAKVQQECQADLQKAFTKCEEAAKAKGADQTADINCLKYLLSSKKDCWPCICDVAKKEGWKIKGCDAVVKLIEAFAKLNLRT